MGRDAIRGGGLGTPSVVGVLILAALGALALRTHLFRRARLAAAGGNAAGADTAVREAVA